MREKNEEKTCTRSRQNQFFKRNILVFTTENWKNNYFFHVERLSEWVLRRCARNLHFSSRNLLILEDFFSGLSPWIHHCGLTRVRSKCNLFFPRNFYYLAFGKAKNEARKERRNKHETQKLRNNNRAMPMS